MPSRHLVLWDGQCDFCRKSTDWLRAHDRFHRLDFCPYQEADLGPAMKEACSEAMHVVKSNGDILWAGRAAMFCGRCTRWHQLARIGEWPVFLPFVEVGYKIVAANRDLFSQVLFPRSP